MFDILLDGEPADIALVDAAVYDDIFMGSRAVWHMEKVPQIFLTRCSPSSIGLSAIGGQLRSMAAEEPAGLALELGHPAQVTVTAAIAPGMFADVDVQNFFAMLPGEIHRIPTSPCLIAVDGEREVEIPQGSSASIRLNTKGPMVVDVSRVMDLASEHALFTR